MDVVVSSKPLDVVYNVPLVERIQKFFDASDDVVANDALTASYAVQMDVSGCVCVCWVAHSLYEWLVEWLSELMNGYVSDW